MTVTTLVPVIVPRKPPQLVWAGGLSAKNFYYGPAAHAPMPIPQYVPWEAEDNHAGKLVQGGYGQKRRATRKKIYSYSTTQRIVRFEAEDPEKGWQKTFVAMSLEDGQWLYKGGKESWPWYREAENYGTQVVLSAEGEKCIDSLVGIGLRATGPCGGGWHPKKLRDRLEKMSAAARTESGGLIVVFIPDGDDEGQKKASKLFEACNEFGIACLILDIKALGGDERRDVADVIAEIGKEEFEKRLSREIEAAQTRHAQKIEEWERLYSA